DVEAGLGPQRVGPVEDDLGLGVAAVRLVEGGGERVHRLVEAVLLGEAEDAGDRRLGRLAGPGRDHSGGGGGAERRQHGVAAVLGQDPLGPQPEGLDAGDDLRDGGVGPGLDPLDVGGEDDDVGRGGPVALVAAVVPARGEGGGEQQGSERGGGRAGGGGAVDGSHGGWTSTHGREVPTTRAPVGVMYIALR